MGLTLREVRDEDLPLLFEEWADPVAVHIWPPSQRPTTWTGKRSSAAGRGCEPTRRCSPEPSSSTTTSPDDRLLGRLGRARGDVLDRPLLLGQRDRARRPQGVLGRLSVAAAPRARRVRQRRVPPR